MHHYLFVNCNKYTALMQEDVTNRGTKYWERYMKLCISANIKLVEEVKFIKLKSVRFHTDDGQTC